jgi:hypothetical protein
MGIFCSVMHYSSAEAVDAAFTDVVAIEPVEGGWLVFRSATDWATWKGQV